MTKAMLIMLLLAGPAVAGQEQGPERTVMRLDWAALAEAGQVQAGQVVPRDDGGGGSALHVVGEEQGRQVITALVIDRPPLTRRKFALRGEVRYRGMAEQSHLEMWTHLGGADAIHTRTLADEGLFAQLVGDSDWRPFALPCILDDKDQSVEALGFSIVMAGPGEVWVSDMRLVALVPDSWWTNGGAARAAVLVLLAGLACRPVTTRIMAAESRAKRKATAGAMFVIGAAVVMLGVAAAGQRSVWSGGLIIAGAVLATWPVMVLRAADRRDRQLGREAGDPEDSL